MEKQKRCCTNCGTQIENEGVKFCPNCGNLLFNKNNQRNNSIAKVLVLSFSFILISILIVHLEHMPSFVKKGIVEENDTTKSETDLFKDSLELAISSNANITREELKFFEKKMGGLTTIAIETGYIPANFLQSAPVFIIYFVNINKQTITWDYNIKWRVIIDDVYVSSSYFLSQEPSHNDPISFKQVFSISNNGSVNSCVREVQKEKSKVIIEILQGNQSILKLPIKNELINLSNFI